MKKNIVGSILLIAIGTFLFAMGINMFSVANHLGEGGVTGISLLAFYTLDVPVAITSFVLNGIILVIGFRFLEKSTMRLTLLATLLMSVFLHLTAAWRYPMETIILAPLCSGFLVGTGLGLVMQAGGSTAGTDIIALIFNKYLGWSTSIALVVLDLFVVGPSIFVIGLENVVLTVVHLYVQTKVLDFILEGFNPKKQVLIISERHQEIADAIDKKIGRGMTFLEGEGYYSKSQKKVILIVVNRQQLMPLNRIVTAIDPKAFFTISEAQSVIGEGFSYLISDEQYQQKINDFIDEQSQQQ
ncbi:YitT family protein [uncultured Trichococcus sp.]|uniref:YitT family protein n=1 Tax=uncultured Trichococcus sp. TaxID=189665 RepID=UPI002597DC3B|nr:YitT family protein [uncultured Trichococcus sp.]